jgi:hypothetical protein
MKKIIAFYSILIISCTPIYKNNECNIKYENKAVNAINCGRFYITDKSVKQAFDNDTLMLYFNKNKKIPYGKDSLITIHFQHDFFRIVEHYVDTVIKEKYKGYDGLGYYTSNKSYWGKCLINARTVSIYMFNIREENDSASIYATKKSLHIPDTIKYDIGGITNNKNENNIPLLKKQLKH